jgi:hypothetical protein
MQSSIGRRRIKTFKEFIGSQRSRQKRLKLREAGNQVDATEIEYCVTALPRDLPQSEKLARIAELADTITNIPTSDVFCFSLLIG